MQELIDKLNYYTKLYDEGHPEISDKEWDDLYFELVKMEEESGMFLPESPTRKISYQVVSSLEKVKHSHPMLSLDKTKELADVESFINDKEYIAMCKMDGLTCSLRYENGKLVAAETRGNGEIGENILHNALVIKSIPHSISYKETLVIDGEIICREDDFEPFANEYKNPRNFAAGSIRLLDNKECKGRNLTFVAWDVIKGFDNLTTLSWKLIELKKYNFIVVPFEQNHIIAIAIDYLKRFAYLERYPIDGIVFKYDDIEYYKSLGNTDHHFRGGLAYKFYDEEYETELLDIEWTMGRTGVLTPVAIYKDIDIDGSVCNRASLHNVSVMYDTLHCQGFEGQKIKIFKANMIIPQISWAEEDDDRTKKYIQHPCVCPICKGQIKINNNEGVKTLVCTNELCEGKIINRMDHFFGKKGLDIKGLSKATFEKLIDAGLISTISDVFTLERWKKEWEALPGFGPKSVSSCLTSIKQGCTTNLAKTISAAGIPLIGTTIAKDLSKRFKDYDDFRAAIENEKFNFSDFDGYGPEMNRALKEFNYTEIDYIVENFLTIEETNAGTGNTASLEGKTFVITGKLSRKRDDIKVDIENAGGKVSSVVSSKTTYLVCNQLENTSKYKKALELKTPIINEEELMEMLK